MPAQRPYFIPKGLDLRQLPSGVQEAVEHIILPAYDELVIRAASSLERAAGTTLCYEMWLELLEQFEIGRTLRERFPRRPVPGIPVNSAEPYKGPFLPDSLSLKRYLQLTARKEQVQKFLLQLRVARARWGASINGPIAVRPASPPTRPAASDAPSADTPRPPLEHEVAQDASNGSGNGPRRRQRRPR